MEDRTSNAAATPKRRPPATRPGFHGFPDRIQNAMPSAKRPTAADAASQTGFFGTSRFTQSTAGKRRGRSPTSRNETRIAEPCGHICTQAGTSRPRERSHLVASWISFFKTGWL